MQDITDPGEKRFTLVLSKFSLTLKLLTRQSRSAVLLLSKARDSSSNQGRALSVWSILSLQQTENSIRNRLCHTSEGRQAAPIGGQGAGKALGCPQPTTAGSLTDSAGLRSLLRAQVLMVVPRQGLLYVLPGLSQPAEPQSQRWRGQQGGGLVDAAGWGPFITASCVTPVGSGGL